MYWTIMVPLDGSKRAECVLPYVKILSHAGVARKIIFVRVIDFVIPPLGEGYMFDEERIRAGLRTDAEEYLRKLSGQRTWGRVDVEWRVLSGGVAETLVDFVKDNGVDLTVIATHGRSGVNRWMRGSVADRILHSSTKPVLMVQAFQGHGDGEIPLR